MLLAHVSHVARVSNDQLLKYTGEDSDDLDTDPGIVGDKDILIRSLSMLCKCMLFPA